MLVILLAAVGLAAADQRGAAPGAQDFPSDLDHFFYVVALNFKAPDLCSKIGAQSGRGASTTKGYRLQNMRSRCYAGLASAIGDPALCDRLPAAGAPGPDGGELTRENCKTHGAAFRDLAFQAVPDLFGANPPFVGLMRSLGYGDAEVAQARYAENWAITDAYEFYEKLRGDAAFVQRLESSPGFAESRDHEKIRPANPLEFLDQLVAIDLNDPSLCAKVSPNATFVAGNNRVALLQSHCYLSIALNTHNETGCDPLPASSSSFPHVNTNYDSAESCRSAIAIYKRRNVESGLRNGPQEFPRLADFNAALQQIGWPARYTPTITPDDYWEFVTRIVFRGTPEAQREFVARVKKRP